MEPFAALLIIIAASLSLSWTASGSLLAQPVPLPEQPGPSDAPNTVPALPLQAESQSCRLDLSDELFGGVSEACGGALDRSRCCPVLAAWLFAAHARSALQLPSAAAPSAASAADDQLPMMPESDSQRCVASLQSSLQRRNIRLAQPNATCDTVLCFCGIRLHQISSLSCPAAFNSTSAPPPRKNATAASPTAGVRNLEKSCRNSSYAGCTRCLAALEELRDGGNNGTSSRRGGSSSSKLDGRASKMFNRDCQLMGLTWLLARNKTLYIPTVSAVLRAIMYSAHPPNHSNPKCSPDQENMPLAVDSLQFDKAASSSSPWPHVSPLSLSSYPSLSLLATTALALLAF